jgi:hypothetical protein
MNWVYDDGGRKAAGFRGRAGDCVTRSIAIATRLPYRHVCALLDEQAQRERPRPEAGALRRGTASSVKRVNGCWSRWAGAGLRP